MDQPAIITFYDTIIKERFQEIYTVVKYLLCARTVLIIVRVLLLHLILLTTLGGR